MKTLTHLLEDLRAERITGDDLQDLKTMTSILTVDEAELIEATEVIDDGLGFEVGEMLDSVCGAVKVVETDASWVCPSKRHKHYICENSAGECVVLWGPFLQKCYNADKAKKVTT